eukprot:NODE_123_length_18841_cov_0.279693.p4 type:complete len:375 gc:universal NODE_123_length_18841_cov_0.279693:990-2114(+)
MTGMPLNFIKKSSVWVFWLWHICTYWLADTDKKRIISKHFQVRYQDDVMHHQILLVSFLIFSALFYNHRINKPRIMFSAPLNMPSQKCVENWCSNKNEFVLPGSLIKLIKILNITTSVYKRDAYIDAMVSNYLNSNKFKYIAVDVKNHHGIVLLNYYVKSVWAGLMTKRELLVNDLLLPTKHPFKRLKGYSSMVTSAKQLFQSTDIITSIDPNLPMGELNVPLLQIPANMASLLLNHIIYDLSVLPASLYNTIQLYQNVLSNPEVYSISIKLSDRLPLKCIESLLAGHKNPVLFISGPRKLVRRLQLKLFYRNIAVLTTIQSKYLEIFNSRIDWAMIHDFISLSCNHLVSDEHIKSEFEAFTVYQNYTVFNKCY